MTIDYLGFDIPDVRLVGYGLDYPYRYRTLPHIAELQPKVYDTRQTRVADPPARYRRNRTAADR